MATNQTIDGVPRELLVRLLNAAEWQKLDFERSDSQFKVEIASTVNELRALLDADKCTSCDGSGEYIDAIGDWRGYCVCPAGVALENKPAAQPQGEPVAWRTNRGGVCELFGSLQEAEDDIAQWASIAAPHDDYDRTPTPLYAHQPGPVAADETAEFSKWTHQVIAESRIGGVTIKVQRMQHMTPGEEKSAHDAWMARADLSNKSR